jgi:hypothetical protein
VRRQAYDGNSGASRRPRDPHVPVRQWVLTMPHRLRYRMGYDHDLCKRILRV